MPVWRRAANSAASEMRQAGGIHMSRPSFGLVRNSAVAVPSPLVGQGGGYRLLRGLKDRERDTFQIRQDVVIGEPQHAIAVCGEPLVTPLITTTALLEVMALTIDLHDPSAGMGDEVGDVVTERASPPEAKTHTTMSLEMAPEQGLGARHRAAQLLGACSLKR